MINNSAVGKTIAALRQDRGMTQQQLAAALNVSHQAVSKWENGAALPDIQTMIELTRFFGITVEQLIDGDIPSMETNGGEKTIDEHLRDIGSLVSDAIETGFEDIGSLVNDAIEGHFSDDDRAEDAEYEAEGPVHVPEDETGENEKSVGDKKGEMREFDVQKLLRMAPFMSKGALGAILLENRERLTPDDISKFAPFLSRETLEELISDAEGEISWETLQRIAPFLKREIVDVLARCVANGQRIVRRVVTKQEKKQENQSGDFERSIEDVTQKIGAGVEKVARNAVKFGEELIAGISAQFCEPKKQEAAKESRARALRNSAIRRAVEDGRWDWIAARLADIQDEEMRGMIAHAAREKGMNDWLRANLPEFAQISDAEKALEDSNWIAVSEQLDRMEAGYRQRAAEKAANEGNWIWIEKNAVRLEFGEKASPIAMIAYEAGALDAVVAIAENALNEDETESLMSMMILRDDHDAAARLCHLVNSDFLEGICRELASEGKWKYTEAFLGLIVPEGIERLMELAIEQGDFDAIDILDKHLGE